MFGKCSVTLRERVGNGSDKVWKGRVISMNGQSCEKCVFWKQVCNPPIPNMPDGVCRRKPPPFPPVGSDDWCGEFQSPETIESRKATMSQFKSKFESVSAELAELARKRGGQ